MILKVLIGILFFFFIFLFIRINAVNKTLDNKIDKSLSNIIINPSENGDSNSGGNVLTMSQVEAKINSKLGAFNSQVSSSSTNISPNITYSTPNLNELGFEIDHSGNKIICNKKIEFKGNYDTLPVGTIIMWHGTGNPGPCWKVCNGTYGTPNLEGRIPISTGGVLNVTGSNGTPTVPLKKHTHTISNAGAHGNHLSYTKSNTTTGLDNTAVEWNIKDGQQSLGGHIHGMATAGTNEGTWTKEVLPPVFGLKFFMKVRCT
jgi:hypothetical protein